MIQSCLNYLFKEGFKITFGTDTGQKMENHYNQVSGSVLKIWTLYDFGTSTGQCLANMLQGRLPSFCRVVVPILIYLRI